MRLCPVLPSRSSNPKHKLCYRPSVIREIEIWRVAMLMINRYADEAEANSFRRAEELTAEGDHAGAAICRDRAAYRHDGTAKLIKLQSRRERTHI